MNKIYFEDVSDVNITYPYICIYYGDSNQPFMDISITDNKELVFNIYQNNESVQLSSDNWNRIMEKALEFYPKAIKNEEDYQKYFVEHQDPD